MSELAMFGDAKWRIARVSLEDGLGFLFFGLFFLINGSLDWIGSMMPRETIRFDVFNLQVLQASVAFALLFLIRRARSKFVVPRVGFVEPKPRKWYFFVAFGLTGAVIPLLFLGRNGHEVFQSIKAFAPATMALLFAAMFLIAGGMARLPRMTWLGVALLVVAAWGYRSGASYTVLKMVVGAMVTIVCALQFLSFLKAHPTAEREA